MFDLDDTLYLERDYVASGFRAAATLVSEHSTHAQSVVYDWLWAEFCSGDHSNALERLVVEFPVAELSVETLVEAYRSQDPKINLLPDVAPMLDDLRDSGKRIGMITDGDSARQRKKVAALGLLNMVDELLVTGDLGLSYWKPHPRSFEVMQNRLDADRLTYVGDNPHKDFVAPNALGWTTARLEMEGQLHAGAAVTEPTGSPHFVVHSIAELASLLNRNSASRPST